MRKRGPSKRAPKRKPIRWFVFAFLSVAFCAVLVAGIGLCAFYLQLDRSLPSTQSLKDYHPPLVSTVYSADGELIGEFFVERRYITALKDMPPYLTKAFLAAEDVRFYEHGGVDFFGILRASFKNLQAGEIVQGGSTITQQVVKSLLLTPERTMTRKLKEALLAYRIDHSLSKDEILYLYLNQIYFGSGAYGVEAAARTYFDKHVQDLTLAESALLAGLPKAPTRFSPVQHLAVARERQHYVLSRMAEVGFISDEEAQKAYAKPLQFAKPKHWTLKDLDSFTRGSPQAGRSTLRPRRALQGRADDPHDPRLKAQDLAEKALDQGLRELDKRHKSYRGIHANVPREDWPGSLKVLTQSNGDLAQGKVVAALVKDFDARTDTVLLSFGSGEGKLPASGWGWTHVSDKRAAKMFRVGDIIRVRLDKRQEDKTWLSVLEQDPGMEGAFMAMVPDTGRVLCMVGGRNFEKSQFNRCTQAVRQPGSSFKPIIYSAALDKGYSEASILIDSPLVLDDHSLRGPWKPANYDRQFWGPILLRKALIHSRNVVTVKLLDAIGVNYAISYAKRLGIMSQLTPTLALALGASGVTLSELLTAYSSFANLGERVDPYIVDKVYDRHGQLLEEHQVSKELVIPPQTAYVMTNLLEGVIQEGTGTKAKELGRPAAGKTGTTNELKDAWFIGYTPTVLAGVWVGYDDHNISLGKGETGGRAACPIWLYFMKEYLKDQPVTTFAIPEGVVFAKINPQTGSVSKSEESGGVYAAFSGAPPEPGSGPSAEAEGSESPAGPMSPPSESESFFKSDLF